MDRTSTLGLAFGLLAGGLALGMPSSAHAKSYKGGELYSSQAYLHGRIEVRMRVARGSGLLSTFFTYKNGSETAGTFWEEIDIEVFGKDNAVGWQSNIITGSGTRTTSEQVHTGTVSLADDYHTYALEWTPDHVAWELDGVVVRETTGGQVGDLTNPQSLRFNLWAANIESWVGAFDSSVLPQYQYVNWIRYSRYEGGQFIHEWTDDFDSFDAGRWGRADWTFGENLVDFDPNNVVVRDGTLILALTREGQTGFSGTVPQDSGASGGSGTGGVTSSGGESSDGGTSESPGLSGGGGGGPAGGDGLGGSPDGGVTGSGGASVGGSQTGGTTAAGGGGPVSGAVGGFGGSGGAPVGGSGVGGATASGGHGLGGALVGGGNGNTSVGGRDLADTSGGGSSLGGVASGGTSAGPGQGGSGTALGGRASGGAIGSGGDAVGVVGTSSSGGSMQPIGSGGADGTEPLAGSGEDDSGCSCRIPPYRVRSPGGTSLLLAGLVWGLRRWQVRTDRIRRKMLG